MTVITDFVNFSRTLKYEDIPVEIREFSVKAFLDTVAVMCCGAKSPKTQALVGEINKYTRAEEATVIGQKPKTSMVDAALVNGMLAHVDDYDDSGLPGHVSAVLVPAALAAGQYSGASGRDVIRAYCIGVELQFKLAEIMSPMINQNGWHATCVYGALGSAAIAATLLGLEEGQYSNALAIATSKASGVVVNFGTATKSYQNGLAAANGIQAALLARAGLDGSHNAFEGVGGLFQCFSGLTSTESEISFGGEWGLQRHGICQKKFPCCLGSHGASVALLSLMKQYKITADQVESVTGEVMGYAYRCLSYPEPKNELEAKFSLPYALGSILQDGKLNLRSFDEDKLSNDSLRAQMRKVQMKESKTFKYLDLSSPANVEVKLKDGRVLSTFGNVDCTGGMSLGSGMTFEELAEKFLDCAETILSVENAEEAIAKITNMESVYNIEEIMAIVQ